MPFVAVGVLQCTALYEDGWQLWKLADHTRIKRNRRKLPDEIKDMA